ncbi:MAG: carbohydrate kinase family protein [Treponemataceae bacterium]
MKNKGTILVMGGLVRDVVYCIDHYPARGMDAVITAKKEIPGGCPLNVAIALKNLGLNPYIVAALGDTAADRALAAYLSERGLLDDCVCAEKEGETGFCVNIVEKDGERTFLTYKGIESIFRESMIPDHLMPEISYVYLTGYYLQEREYYEPILNTLGRLRDRGAVILFDPGSLVSEIDPKTLSRVLELSFCVTPNEQEWKLIEHALKPKRSLLHRLFDGGTRLVLLKNGKHGVRAVTPEREVRSYPYDVATIDTTGAGDCFAAGILYSLVAGENLERSLAFAGACGSLATTFSGPHGEFDRTDIDRIIAEARELRV